MKEKIKLILASRSPRRKELLSHLDIPFEIITMNIPEISKYKKPDLIVKDLAKQKAYATFNNLEKKENQSYIIIGADTIVSIGNTILGIPKDQNHAKKMLLKMSGKKHQVFTGVCIIYLTSDNLIKEKQFAIKTDVLVKEIDKDLLQNYLDSDDPYDKAGSYGIQGKALSFIKEIKGSYSNVVGFPLQEFHQELKNILGHRNDKKGKWRTLFV